MKILEICLVIIEKIAKIQSISNPNLIFYNIFCMRSTLYFTLTLVPALALLLLSLTRSHT